MLRGGEGIGDQARSDLSHIDRATLLPPWSEQEVADQQGESGKQAILEAPFVRLRPEAAPRPSWLCERVQQKGAGAAREGESIAAAGVNKKGLVARAHFSFVSGHMSQRSCWSFRPFRSFRSFHSCWSCWSFRSRWLAS